MANPWFRLYTEIIDDEKMRLLAFEDRWHYVAILCCKNAGLLDVGDSNAMLMRKLGVKLGLASRELEAALLRLEEVGLIDASTAQPAAWDERQFLSDSSTSRVKAYRERKKQAGNVSVTAQDTDTDKDSEEDKAYTSSVEAFSNCPHSEIVDLYHRYMPANPRMKVWNGDRAKSLMARWREDPKRQSLDYWERFFKHCSSSMFLTGRTEGSQGRPFLPGLDWMVKPSNFAKIIENRYHERQQ